MDPEIDELLFQCVDVVSRDIYIEANDYEINDEASDSNKYSKNNRFAQYQVLLFGTMQNGKTVCMQFNDFRPYFFIEIPENMSQSAIGNLENVIMNKVPMHSKGLITITEERAQKLYYFSNNKLTRFLRIQTPSQKLWRDLRNIFMDKNCLPVNVKLTSSSRPMVFPIYEANIDPVLRFFHAYDLDPAGWIRVKPGAWDWSEDEELRVHYTVVAETCEAARDVLSAAPRLIASWDIECMSSHGDFPLAKKTMRKTAREIIEGKWSGGIPQVMEELATVITGKRGKILSSVYLIEPWKAITAIQMQKHFTASDQRFLQSCLEGPTDRDVTTERLDTLLTSIFHEPQGDQIIQIGVVFWRNNQPESKYIFVLGSCTPVVAEEGRSITTVSCDTEADLIQQWMTLIDVRNPDVLIGYNIFGFDCKYVWDRADILGVTDALRSISRIESEQPKLQEKFLSSAAMGDNTMYILSGSGRLQVDLLPYIRRNYQLDKYSLDATSATFMSGEVKGEVTADPVNSDLLTVPTKSTKGIVPGRYIVLMDTDNDAVCEKCEVVAMSPKSLQVKVHGGLTTIAEFGSKPTKWSMVKDDVEPKEIFRLHKGNADDRSRIAKYCLQDCDLVMELFNKLEILNNSVAMANVCSVPVNYIFMRGQGVKIESLIFKACAKRGTRVIVLPAPQQNRDHSEAVIVDEEAAAENQSYEGAIVLDPVTGIYLEDPVAVLDFASLYPSSIISENMSHDTMVWVKDFQYDGTLIKLQEGSDTYDNLPGLQYVNIEYDILTPNADDTRKHKKLIKTGLRVARYVQPDYGTLGIKLQDDKSAKADRGIIPDILIELLKQRKATRNLQKTEKDEFKWGLLEAQQLAYKVTANSLYGQLGSPTSKIRAKAIAASTTAYGRKQIMFAKEVIEELYADGTDPRCAVEIVYGDTDSLFMTFKPKDPLTNIPIKGKESLQIVMDIAKEAGHILSGALKPPHDFEYDKMFWPFCLLSKKRYVGNKYEEDLDHPHMTSMGIVLKRRDNAPIVKYVYGGAIDRILHQRDITAAAKFVMSSCEELMQGKFGMKKLTITKSLRAEYANPTRIAHKVLADRIGVRDPGNKPSTSDRIPFVYVRQPEGQPEPMLQGDRIETPSYVIDKSLKIDYAYYIERQIAVPTSQVFGLVVEQLPGWKNTMASRIREAGEKGKTPDQSIEKMVEEREEIARELLFGEILRKGKNLAANTAKASFINKFFAGSASVSIK